MPHGHQSAPRDGGQHGHTPAAGSRSLLAWEHPLPGFPFPRSACPSWEIFTFVHLGRKRNCSSDKTLLFPLPLRYVGSVVLIDTHCHLDFPDFDADRVEVIRRASQAGVTRLITIGTTLETSRAALALADSHPHIFATVGLHPCEVESAPDSAMEQLATLARHPKVVALGECGLDYHRLPSLSTPLAKSSPTPGAASAGTRELSQADVEVKCCGSPEG
ncbi:TatD family deoxyribonuclease [bacterium]|nr:TatD family deoxyribonuclease [bacterium]